MATDQAMMLIACPCGQRMKVPADAVGKTAACVRCGKSLRISQESENQDDSGASNPARRTTPSGTDIPDAIDILLQYELVNAQAVREALILQQDLGISAWELMARLGRYSYNDLHELMAKQKRVAAIDISNYDIPAEVLSSLPEDLVRRGKLLPVDKLGKLITVAMVCPLDSERIFEIEQITGLKAKPMLATHEAMKGAIERYYTNNIYSGWPHYFDSSIQEELQFYFDRSPVPARLLNVHQLPLLPRTHLLMGETRGSEDGLLRRARAFLHDPPAMARLLSLANSSAYGRMGGVDSAGLACALLGADGMDELFMNDEAPSPDNWTREESLVSQIHQETRFAVAVAEATAEAIAPSRKNEFMTVGALYNFGRYVMARTLPNSYTFVTEGETGTQIEREERAYGISFREVGYFVSRLWSLPQSLRLSAPPASTMDGDANDQCLLDFEPVLHAIVQHTQHPEEPFPELSDGPLQRLGLTVEQVKDIYQHASSVVGETAGSR